MAEPSALPRRLAWRLLGAILLVSSLVTLLGTALQLWLDYRRDVEVIEGRLRQVREGYLGSLTGALWASDLAQVDAQLEGIARLPDVERVTVDLEDGTRRAAGEVRSASTLSRAWPVTYEYRGRAVPLGTLEATVGLDSALERLRGRVAVILGTQATKTLLVSLFILFVFHLLVTRHLARLAAYARGLGPDRLEEPFELAREPPPPDRPDELQVVVDAVDAMRLKLLASYRALSEHGAALEREVDARTAELAEANERLTFLLAHLPGAIWTVDADLRVTSAAGARVDALARAGALAVGARLGELAGATGDGPTATDAHAAALEGRPGTYELVADRHTYEVRVEPLPGRGGAAAIAVALDVTARRRLEAERLGVRVLQSQKMESLGLLAGGVAHDFNNLLVGILGNAGLALGRLPEEAPAAEPIRRIEVAAERAAELTRQMLAYSGKGRFVVRPLDVSAVVREMTSLLGVTLPKHVTLRLSLGEGLPAVEADRAQLQQLVMNLITNAADAIGAAPGTVRVSTGRVEADRAYLADAYLDDPLPEGAYVALEVTDTGCGMDAATVARMFDPFFTSKETGHGLGLAAALGIVRGHRGTIKVSSEPGAGTTMKVLLPASEAHQAAAEDAPAPAPSARALEGATVLVADDDPGVLALARMALEEAGASVVGARDGVEALEAFRAAGGAVDLVLLDMTMPRMGGRDAFRELRRLRPDLPVVLSSGYSEQEATDALAGHGLAGFIQKPYRVHELVEALARHRPR